MSKTMRLYNAPGMGMVVRFVMVGGLGGQPVPRQVSAASPLLALVIAPHFKKPIVDEKLPTTMRCVH